jgi:hypothetical protein
VPVPEHTVLIFQASPSEFSIFPKLVTIGLDGTFKTSLSLVNILGNAKNVSVSTGLVSSNNVPFLSVLGDGSGDWTFIPDKNKLFFGQNDVNIFITYKGISLPAGLTINLDGSDEFTNLPSSLVTKSDGSIFFDDLYLDDLSKGSYLINGSFSNIQIGTAHFAGDLEPGDLVMTPDIDVLEFLKPTKVVFSFYYAGKTIPKGTIASIIGSASDFENKPQNMTASEEGKITAPSFKILQTVSKPVKGSAAGLSTEDVFFDVYLDQSKLKLSVDKEFISPTTPEDVVFSLKYDGEKLPPGINVSFNDKENALINLPSQAVTGPDGEISVPGLKSKELFGDPWQVSVTVAGKESNEVSFKILDDLNGEFVLKVEPNSLYYLDATNVDFFVLYNNEPIPSNVLVDFNLVEGDIDGLPSNQLTIEGGKIQTVLTAEDLDQVKIGASVGGNPTNNVLIDVNIKPEYLGLSADPLLLELFVPQNTTFTFTYKDGPVPDGTLVSFSTADGQFENLPPSATTNALGQVEVLGLTAIKIADSLTIDGFISMVKAGSVDFEVFLNSANLFVNATIDPYFPAEDGGAEDSDGRPVLVSCKFYDYEMTVLYHSRPIANEEVNVVGFKFEPSGINLTNSLGIIKGTIYYSLIDQETHLDVGDDYTISVAGAQHVYPGPLPVEFHGCH